MKTVQEFNEFVHSGNVRFKTFGQLKAEGWYEVGSSWWEHEKFGGSILNSIMTSLDKMEFNPDNILEVNPDDQTFSYRMESGALWFHWYFLTHTDCNVDKVSVTIPSVDELLGLL